MPAGLSGWSSSDDMIEIKLNNKLYQVEDGISVLEAAKRNNIHIPTMCYVAGLTNNPSCMVCLVKDMRSGNLEPSCALPVSNGMDIVTDNEEIHMARKESLELLVSDHVGDCEAPCQPSCPAAMNIPLMNRHIHDGNTREAIEVIKKDIAIPLILGNICPAPCEKACRREQVDNAVAICHLKKHVALEDLRSSKKYIPVIKENTGKKVAVVGTGPAGLSCAYYLILDGHLVTFFDKNQLPGGTLRYNINDDKLPKDELDMEIDHIRELGARFVMNTEITPEYFTDSLQKKFDAIVMAIGNYDDSNASEFVFKKTSYGVEVNRKTYELDMAGVFACGNIIRSRRMAITSAAQGKTTAESVSKYLEGTTPSAKSRMFNSKFGKLKNYEVNEYLKESNSGARNTSTDDFNKSEASTEASRCMHCDCRKPDNCLLRIYSSEYNVKRNSFAFSERRDVIKQVDNEKIIFEPEKCIKCNICVQFCEKEGAEVGFTNIGRGMDMVIDVPFGHSIDEIPHKIAAKCAELCPTAAISLK